MGSRIEEEYRGRTRESARLHQRARASMPGGDTRTSARHEPYPLVIERGDGPYLWDVDGNRYLDLLYNYTSLVHGHAYPPVVEAARRVVGRGSAWPAGARGQVDLAELLCERLPSVERIRFCNSGTEAGMLAAKLARAVTGRRSLLKARFGYHGSYEDLESNAPERDGLPGRTLLADFGDAGSFEEVLAERGLEIAAVFLEPVMGVGGVIEGEREFLERVQEASRRAGALFVLDEVITFRLSEGGAQSLKGLRPDLTMLGKTIGGGFPVGALGGSERVMASFDPSARGSLHHSGTFNGNPVTCAAGLIAVRDLTGERIRRMDEQAETIERELQRAARSAGLPFSMRRAGSLLNVFFRAQPPPPLEEAAGADAMHQFHLACLNRGLFIAPRGMMALATVITDELVGDITERLGEALLDVVADVPAARG